MLGTRCCQVEKQKQKWNTIPACKWFYDAVERKQVSKWYVKCKDISCGNSEEHYNTFHMLVLIDGQANWVQRRNYLCPSDKRKKVWTLRSSLQFIQQIHTDCLLCVSKVSLPSLTLHSSKGQINRGPVGQSIHRQIPIKCKYIGYWWVLRRKGEPRWRHGEWTTFWMCSGRSPLIRWQ